jgi:hypothetical protein
MKDTFPIKYIGIEMYLHYFHIDVYSHIEILLRKHRDGLMVHKTLQDPAVKPPRVKDCAVNSAAAFLTRAVFVALCGSCLTRGME